VSFHEEVSLFGEINGLESFSKSKLVTYLDTIIVQKLKLMGLSSPRYIKYFYLLLAYDSFLHFQEFVTHTRVTPKSHIIQFQTRCVQILVRGS
jgi:hypothetical protein